MKLKDATALDLGGGHRIEWTRRQSDTDEDQPAGLIHYHPKPGGGQCAGCIAFAGKGDGKRPEWDVVSWEPLTLSPSLLCRSCGSHGLIQGGRWLDA